jgi:hypothetical protein
MQQATKKTLFQTKTIKPVFTTNKPKDLIEHGLELSTEDGHEGE